MLGAMDLNQVTLPSTDVARGAAFYRRLGLRQIVENLPSYVRFEDAVGNVPTLSLIRVESLSGPSHVTVYFECEHLDARVKELTDAGLVFESGPVDQPWLWREAALRDPDGNVICLFHAGKNRKHPPWRLP